MVSTGRAKPLVREAGLSAKIRLLRRARRPGGWARRGAVAPVRCCPAKLRPGGKLPDGPLVPPCPGGDENSIPPGRRGCSFLARRLQKNSRPCAGQGRAARPPCWRTRSGALWRDGDAYVSARQARFVAGMASRVLRQHKDAHRHEGCDTGRDQWPADIHAAEVHWLVQPIAKRRSQWPGQDKGCPEQQNRDTPVVR